MEVVLKKTKITKSIVEQSLSGNYSLMYEKLDNYTILGWCSHKTGKYTIRRVLLYNKLNNFIIKLPYSSPEKITIKEEIVQRDDKNCKGGYVFPVVKIIIVQYPDLNNSLRLEQREDETYEDMEEKLKNIKDFYRIVNEKGQIYL